MELENTTSHFGSKLHAWPTENVLRTPLAADTNLGYAVYEIGSWFTRFWHEMQQLRSPERTVKVTARSQRLSVNRRQDVIS